MAAAPAVEQFAPAPTEWERRGDVGFFAGYYQTLKREMLTPDPFWRSVRPDGSLWDALAFAWIAWAVNWVLASPLQWFWFKLQTMSTLGSSTADAQVRQIFEWIASPVVLAAWIVGGVLLYPVFFLISAGIFHLGCLLFGAGKSGFGATARALGYATGPSLLAWVPCVGFVAGIYGLVLEFWGLTRIHRTEVWRPIVGYLVISVLLSCCLCGLPIAIIGAIGGLK